MGTRPHWTYNYQIWCERSRRRRNHWWQILSRSVKGFPVCGVRKWGSPIDLDSRPYNTSALPCCLWYVVIVELFRYHLRLRRCKRKSVEVSVFEPKFQIEGTGALPTNHCWCQKTRVIALSCGVKISAVHCLVLSQSTRVTDRQTDGQTDGRTELR